MELFVRAGLSIHEIACLRLKHVTDAKGKLSPYIRLSAENLNTTRERIVLMHPRIVQALEEFRRAYPGIDYFAMSRRFTGIHHQSTHALVLWFIELYRLAGLEGCSSHLGRPSMIAKLTKKPGQAEALPADVELITGRTSLVAAEHDLKQICKETGEQINSLYFADDEERDDSSPCVIGGAA